MTRNYRVVEQTLVNGDVLFKAMKDMDGVWLPIATRESFDEAVKVIETLNGLLVKSEVVLKEFSYAD